MQITLSESEDEPQSQLNIPAAEEAEAVPPPIGLPLPQLPTPRLPVPQQVFAADSAKFEC